MDTDDTPQATQPDEAKGLSVLDAIRDVREQKLGEKPRRIAINVPAYIDSKGNPRVSVIYAYPEGGYERVMRALRRERQGLAMNDATMRLEGAGDLLLAACVSVVGVGLDGRYVDLLTNADLGTQGDVEPPATPLRFSRKLAELFDIEIPEGVESVPRFILRNVFSPRGAKTGVYEGDPAISATSDAVYEFINGVDLVADEDSLGE
jgi:hypothetical protein